MFNTIIPGIGIVIFLLVLVVIWKVLPEMGFEGFSRGAMAICIAALSVLGLNPGRTSEVQNVILVPYAALGISILLVLLLIVLAASFKWLGLLRGEGTDEVDENARGRESDWPDSE